MTGAAHELRPQISTDAENADARVIAVAASTMTAPPDSTTPTVDELTITWAFSAGTGSFDTDETLVLIRDSEVS